MNLKKDIPIFQYLLISTAGPEGQCITAMVGMQQTTGTDVWPDRGGGEIGGRGG